MTAPRISVIMVDGSFRESFHAIQFFGNQTLSPDEYELIWVDFYQTVDPTLRAEIEQFPNFKIITLGNDPDTTYHSSYCFNRGIMEAQAELVAIPDADVVVERDFLERVWQEHQTNDKLAMYVYRYNVFEKDHIDDWTLEHLREVGRNTNPTNYGSCLTVRKKWLLHINGYEQHPLFDTGFHGNGYDIHCRLKALGLHIMWHPTIKIYHPWHPSTGIYHSNYDKQHAVSEWRAKTLNTLAFQGIDSSLNWSMPSGLRQSLDMLDRQPDDTPHTEFSLKRLYHNLKCRVSVFK